MLLCDFIIMTSRLGVKFIPCNKIDEPQVVCRFSGNVMTPITTLHIIQLLTYVEMDMECY